MLISTRGRYALSFLLDLAEHEEKSLIGLNEVAERQLISKKYLEPGTLSIASGARRDCGTPGAYTGMGISFRRSK